MALCYEVCKAVAGAVFGPEGVRGVFLVGFNVVEANVVNVVNNLAVE